MKVKVRNTKRLQKYLKETQMVAAKISEPYIENNKEYVDIDLTHYSTSLGDDIEATKVSRVLINEYFATRVYD